MSVILTCFAGRQRYMEVLIPYMNTLHVDEVHIWDFTRTPADADFLRHACSHFTIFQVKDNSNFNEYYQYYTRQRYPDPLTVIVKCDDDIVFIDTDRFDSFIAARRNDPAALLLSANIVNHGVCTFINKKRGIVPDFENNQVNIESSEYAHMSHALFLENPQNYISKCNSVNRFSELPLRAEWRFNINFFAVLARDLDMFQHAGIFQDDEGFLGNQAPLLFRRNVVVDLHFVVCHMAFHGQ